MNSRDSMAGLAAGLMNSIVGYPLDVIRIRTLFGKKLGNLSNGFFFSMTYSLIKNGAIWPLQKSIRESTNDQNAFLSGCVANLIPATILNPFNLVRVRYAQSATPMTLYGICKNINSHRELFRGYPITLLRDGIWGGIYFSLYQTLEKDHQKLTSSLISGGVATFITSWIDGIRLYQQKHAESPTSFKEMIKSVSQPNRKNCISTLTGVTRVTLTTSIAHMTFLALSQEKNEN